jgi:hypothetical protein
MAQEINRPRKTGLRPNDSRAKLKWRLSEDSEFHMGVRFGELPSLAPEKMCHLIFGREP